MSAMTEHSFIEIDAFLPMESFSFPFFVSRIDIFTCGLTRRWRQRRLRLGVCREGFWFLVVISSVCLSFLR